MFDKTTLNSLISQAKPEDLSAIASQLFSRVGSLDQRQQELPVMAGHPGVFEKLQTFTR